ncbi:hypothetical protein DW1_1644 [Proteiniborus sp. DW1]|uniref:DUF881 domain-containing protein n=1 Tax=Proteiniborus sp. DW1 TaxID=1889883 RepID=UPI00092E0C0D|nr:DUF881 domain-containing protein [Proteiniborus sp. DW1]SCG83214.1 hypothetical protein DW1_1644 [Proteiniborus sp. DW1]
MGEKKNTGMAWLVILSILLGFLLSFQMNQNIEDYDLVSLKNLQTMKNEISNIRKEIDDIKGLTEERKRELEKLKSVINDEEADISEHLIEEIDKLRLVSGLEDVQGPGIRIIIDDNKDDEIVGGHINDDIVHDSTIQMIINDLKIAGAEAISINGHRVMSRSEIKCGGPTIRFNGRSSAPPFVITAIGDPKLLYASVSAPNTYGWILKEVNKLRVETIMKDNVSIPKYNWVNEEFKYAKQIEEGE